LNRRTYEQAGVDTPGNTPGSTKEPAIGWMTAFLFVTSFFGLLAFSMTYVGAGMICSHLVNLSLLLGAIVSWGIMWPLIKGLKGEWFPASIPESSMKSLNGYKV
jgi:uncharacterized oligopeptide transporter (OPT) family protein